MAEYVEHEMNGLLFRFRDIGSLAMEMQRLIDNPEKGESLGSRGYRFSKNGEIPSIEEHVGKLLEIFGSLRHSSNNDPIEEGDIR